MQHRFTKFTIQMKNLFRKSAILVISSGIITISSCNNSTNTDVSANTTQSEASVTQTTQTNPETTQSEITPEDQKTLDILGGGDDLVFAVQGDKLVFSDTTSEFAAVVNKFNALTNTQLKKATLKYIQQIIDNKEGYEPRQQNLLISAFVQTALGETPALRTAGFASFKDGLVEVSALAGKPAFVDNDGNINNTKEVLDFDNIDFGDDEINAELDKEYTIVLQNNNSSRNDVIVALKKAQKAGLDIRKEFPQAIKDANITEEDLK